MEASINIHSLTATEVQERIGKGELTLVQYAQALLARYRARDEQVDAWVTIRPEQVLEEARQMDALSAEARGPLHGFVIGVKDIITTKGAFMLR